MPARPSSRIYDYWWHGLLAVPPALNTASYERLRHLWIDPTRTRTSGEQRIQEFYNVAWETHLTAAVWENFEALPAARWLPELSEAAGLQLLPKEIEAANWSYGWLCEKPRRKIMDVVVHYRSAQGEEGVLVVEAKTPWSELLPGKDSDPSYYLDVPPFAEFNRRSQIYLVDESALESARALVQDGHHDVGFISWQTLGGLQVAAAADLPIPNSVRALVAGAIQHQLLNFGIVPATLSAEYLAAEPSRAEVDRLPGPERQTSGQRALQRWRLAGGAAAP